MPRPQRVHVPGALYYVTSRALEGTPLFRDARDHEAYLRLLREYQERFGFKLFAFVLLPDALHLCLELRPGTTISAVMHAMNSRYTKHIAKRHGHQGHLFQERFKLTVMEKAPSLLRVTGYLHTLPRRCGLASDLHSYRWSSWYGAWHPAVSSDKRHAPDTDTAEVLAALSHERPGWTYERYVQSIPDAEWDRMQAELERPLVGSTEFLAAVEAKRRESSRSAGETATAMVPDPGTSPQPRPPRRVRSMAITLSTAMATVSLVGAVLAARHIAFLKHTVDLLARENQQTLGVLGEAIRGVGSGVHLASWSGPRSLSGTSWDIQLKAVLAAPSEASLSDRIQFEGDRMTSMHLHGSGFPAGRYTSTPRKAGVLTWESVQVGPGGEMVNWQGEQNGQSVHGEMTRRRPGEPVATFRFIGVNRDARRGGTTET